MFRNFDEFKLLSCCSNGKINKNADIFAGFARHSGFRIMTDITITSLIVKRTFMPNFVVH